MTYYDGRLTKEDKKWKEIRERIKELTSNESSFGWIGLLQKILKNRSRLEIDSKFAMAFETLDEFGGVQGKSEKYFSEIYHPVWPYCHGEYWFLYDYMKKMASIKMDNPNTIVRIDRKEKRLIIIEAKTETRIQNTQNCLPLFPVTAAKQ
jgi:hypothetical protein